MNMDIYIKNKKWIINTGMFWQKKRTTLLMKVRVMIEVVAGRQVNSEKEKQQ